MCMDLWIIVGWIVLTRGLLSGLRLGCGGLEMGMVLVGVELALWIFIDKFYDSSINKY